MERSPLESVKVVSFICSQYPKNDHNSNCYLLTPSTCRRNIITIGEIVVEDLDTEFRQNFGMRKRVQVGFNEILRELLWSDAELHAGLGLNSGFKLICEA